MKHTRNFYSRDTKDVAKELLGMVLVHGYFSGYITETEAYIGTEDKASHASWRKKETCFPMWGPAGFTYVYFTYGMHHMLNIVTEQPELPAAVLIRSLEPVTGIDTMIKNRNTENVQNLTTGPGKLTQALGIRLGRVVNIVESSPTFPPVYFTEAKQVGLGGAPPRPDIEPGSQTITSTVTLYFEKN